MAKKSNKPSSKRTERSDYTDEGFDVGTILYDKEGKVVHVGKGIDIATVKPLDLSKLNDVAGGDKYDPSLMDTDITEDDE